MTRRVQHVRMNESAANQFRGLEGEFIFDTTGKELVIHDGVTPGGFRQARKDLSNVQPATSGNPGKMTAEQVTQLSSLQSSINALNLSITNLNATIAALDSRVAALEADVNVHKSIGTVFILVTLYNRQEQTAVNPFNVVFNQIALNTAGNLFDASDTPPGIRLTEGLLNKTIRFTSSVSFDTANTPTDVIQRVNFGVGDHFPIPQIIRDEINHTGRWGLVSAPWRVTADRIDEVVRLEMQTNTPSILDIHAGSWFAVEVLQ